MKGQKTIDFNTLWREIGRAREYKSAHTREASCPIPPKGGRVTDLKDPVKDATWLVRWDWRFKDGKITGCSKEVVEQIREAMIATSHCTVNGEEVGYMHKEALDMLWEYHHQQVLTIHEMHEWRIETN